MKVRNVIIAVFCLSTLLIQNTVAQKKRELEYSGFFDSYYFRGPVAITVGGGLVGYNGELSGGFPSKPLGNVFSLGANYKVWPRTVFGAELSYFTLKGKDSTSKINGSFTSSNFELDLYSRFYFLDDIVRVAADRSRKPRRLKPYATLGVGFLHYNASAVFGALASDTLILTDSTGAPISSGSSSGKTSASGITVVIPAGLGLSYSFSHRVSLMGEFTYKYSFSDMLDGTNAVPSALKDGYYMFQLKLQLAPWAPKVKRKKKFKGQAPADNGGGTESPNAPSEKPKAEETPSDGKETPAETPAPNQETPAQEVPEPTETPAKETPVQEGDGWDQPQKTNKPAAK